LVVGTTGCSAHPQAVGEWPILTDTACTTVRRAEVIIFTFRVRGADPRVALRAVVRERVGRESTLHLGEVGVGTSVVRPEPVRRAAHAGQKDEQGRDCGQVDVVKMNEHGVLHICGRFR